MTYLFPFGQELHPLVQEDTSPKKVFVLGVYASAVHARWVREGRIICQALAVASEPRIFWDGDPHEARRIIDGIRIPPALGTLEPASRQLNGPSAKALDEHILAPLGYTQQDAWLCDCLPETRLNSNQAKVIRERYVPLMEQYDLNPVTIPDRPVEFCSQKRCGEITEELLRSQAETLILLGDVPISQYLNRAADVPYTTLGQYMDLYGYVNGTETVIGGKTITVLPMAHPRQIGALGSHSEKWRRIHKAWKDRLTNTI